MHLFSKNVEAISKFRASEGGQDGNSIVETLEY
jgi:hypothetical protein